MEMESLEGREKGDGGQRKEGGREGGRKGGREGGEIEEGEGGKRRREGEADIHFMCSFL